MIKFITGNTWQNISSIIGEGGLIGPVKSKNTLEIIFPNEEDEIKERAMLHIEFRLKKYNEKVIEKYQLTNEYVEEFIEFMEKTGLSHFLMFLVDVNKDYFKYDYKSRKNLTFYLRNLSIFIEEIVKEIGKNAKSIEIREKYPTDRSSFRDVLKPICSEENWWNGYEYLTSKGIFSKIDSTNMDTKIDQIPKSVNSYSKKILDEKEKFV